MIHIDKASVQRTHRGGIYRQWNCIIIFHSDRDEQWIIFKKKHFTHELPRFRVDTRKLLPHVPVSGFHLASQLFHFL